MSLKVLLIDDMRAASLQKKSMEDTQEYHVDCAEDAEKARKLLDVNNYDILMIEPYIKEVPLNPHSPRVELIRKARDKNIPVVVSSVQIKDNLLPFFGLVERFDYQAYFGKPYFFEDVDSDLRKVAEAKVHK